MKIRVALILLMLVVACKKDEPIYEVVDVKISAPVTESIGQASTVDQTAMIIRVSLTPPADAVLKIYNRFGETMYSARIHINDTLVDVPVDVSSWPLGTYFGQLTSNTGLVLNCRILLAR